MKKRLLAVSLAVMMLINLFPLPVLALEAQRPEWAVTAFDPLDGGTALQAVPQGGGEPVLPDTLTAWAKPGSGTAYSIGWARDGINNGNTLNSGTIAAADYMGQTISIVRTARGADYADSSAQSLQVPARPNRPTAPLTLTKAANSITITNSYPNCEFSADGTNWNDTGAFTGLTAGTEYTVHVRVKATANTFKSDSMTQAVTTVAGDGSTTVKPGESAEIGTSPKTTVTNDGEKITITTGGTTTTVTPVGEVEVGTGGGVTVPGGSTIKPGNGGPEITVGPGNGGTIGGNGEITIPGGGTAQVGTSPSTTISTGTVTENVHTVTFDSQGGSAVSPATVTHGGKVVKPGNPTKSGYTFGGWYKESGCTTAWNFDTDTVTGDITLYAKWTENAPTHTHAYSSTWSSDANHHWHECSCGENRSAFCVKRRQSNH